MVCRHAPGDPRCGQGARDAAAEDARSEKRRADRLQKELAAMTASPDSMNYEVEDVKRFGPHILMKVKYPNCKNCAYEGTKIMVFLNVTEVDILKWRKIDPHFRADDPNRPKNEAPSPAARFPGSPEGWMDAQAYVISKVPPAKR